MTAPKVASATYGSLCTATRQEYRNGKAAFERKMKSPGEWPRVQLAAVDARLWV